MIFMYLHGLRKWRPFKRQTKATRGCMATLVKVRVCGLGLLPPRLNGGPVCDESATVARLRANEAQYVLTLPLFLPFTFIWFFKQFYNYVLGLCHSLESDLVRL